MTVAHKIITAKDFIETTASGELDLKASRKIIARLAQALQSAGDVNILIDVRAAFSDISQAEIEQVVGEMLQQLAGFRNKIAIVHANRRPEDAERAKQALRAAGLELEMFTDYQKAIEWLNVALYFDIQFDDDKPRPE